MSNLPIQIVDQDDKPVGGATKQVAWRAGLLHRIVRISILDENGNMLIQQRSDQKELFPGRWDNSAAGHVDEGETYDHAAQRELGEELGLHDMPLELLGNYYVEVEDDWRIMKRFTRSYKLVLTKPLPEFRLPAEEVAATSWMKIDDIHQLITNHPEQVTDGLTQVIERYF